MSIPLVTTTFIHQLTVGNVKVNYLQSFPSLFSYHFSLNCRSFLVVRVFLSCVVIAIANAGSNLMGQLGLITPISTHPHHPHPHPHSAHPQQGTGGLYRPVSSSPDPQLMALLKRSGRQVSDKCICMHALSCNMPYITSTQYHTSIPPALLFTHLTSSFLPCMIVHLPPMIDPVGGVWQQLHPDPSGKVPAPVPAAQSSGDRLRHPLHHENTTTGK